MNLSLYSFELRYLRGKLQFLIMVGGGCGGIGCACGTYTYSTSLRFYAHCMLQERLDQHDYPMGYGAAGYTGYYNQTFNMAHTPTSAADPFTNGLLIPRPHVVHGSSSQESTTDNVDHHDVSTYNHTPPLPHRSPGAHSQSEDRAISNNNYHNTFQREINRAVEPFRSTYRDYTERHRQPTNGGHI